MTRRDNRRGLPAESPVRKAIEEDLERLLRILARLLDSGGRSSAEIETSLGWERGHIRQLLDRHQSIEYTELLAILEAISVEPRRYFFLVWW